MSLLHVRQIETFLKDRYASDWKENLSDEANLSRLLARYAVDLTLGDRVGDGATLVEITDGNGDGGIDAVGVDPATNLVVLVQSKWRKDGTGSIDLGSVLKFVHGVRALLDIDSAGIATCTPAAKAAVNRAIETPGGRLKLVLATTASNELSTAVQEPLDDLLKILNDVGDGSAIAEALTYTQATFFDALSQPSREKIDLELQLLEWGKNPEPSIAYYGRVNALQVASWFDSFGDDLFAENIRVVLPKSEINQEILRTVREEPERFWYYNNGITVLAENIGKSLAGSASKDALFLKLNRASVVNGAQTVSTLGRALKDGLSDELQSAYVSIRVIQVASEEDDLGRRVTRFANTQNVVSSQDFVFLDGEQHRLVKELRVLGYEYILRSGETPSGQLDKSIDVRQAAIALACASTEMAHAVLAKREVSRLFDRETGPYKQLFNGGVNGLVLARASRVVKDIDTLLDAEALVSEGTRSGVAIHGRRVIAHVILKKVGRANLGNPDFDFDAATIDLTASTLDWLTRLTAVFPDNSYPGNVFKNQTRCAELIESARGVVIAAG